MRFKDGDKKKPARRPGQVGNWRDEPDHVDEVVEARLDGCPHCGGEVVNVEELLQYLVDTSSGILDDELVPPTSNLAERELRPAVVTRKIGGCNRIEAHAFSCAAICSIAQTAHGRGETLTPYVIRWMQPPAGGPPS